MTVLFTRNDTKAETAFRVAGGDNTKLFMENKSND